MRRNDKTPIKRIVTFLLLPLFIILTLLAIIVYIAPRAVSLESSTPNAYAIQKLKNARLPDLFIKEIQTIQNVEDRARIIELNVLGFVGTPDYSKHYSKRALKKCVELIKKYLQRFKRVENDFGVPKEVIAALLWVETKHGTQMGNYAIGNVYFNLLQADHPEVLKATLATIQKEHPEKFKEYKQKVIDRSIAKSNWALTEIKALEQAISGKNAIPVNTKGSSAGAFGIPQFIPSSYLQWGKSAKKELQVDLFDFGDAIQSVGFYLKANGWKKTKPATHKTALFHYNRAQGYVDVILKIASCVKAPKQTICIE